MGSGENVKVSLFKTTMKHFCFNLFVSEVFPVFVHNFTTTFGPQNNGKVKNFELYADIPKFAILGSLLIDRTLKSAFA